MVASRLKMIAFKRYARPKNIPENEEEKKKIVAKYTRPPGEKAHALVFYYVFSDCISFDPNYRFMTLSIWLYILFKPV